MKNLILITLSLFLFACESGPSYKILKSEGIEQPPKYQSLTRIQITDKVTKENVKSLLNDFYNIDSANGYKKIFVYVYKSKADYEADSGSWIGMISQTPGDVKNIQFKEDLK